MGGPSLVHILTKHLIGKLIVSYALNAVTNKLFANKIKTSSTSPTYSIGTLQTQTNSNMVMPIIYGTVKCAGNNLWQNGSGSTVNRLVGFGLGKNHSVSDVRVNDIPVGVVELISIKNTKYADAYVKVGSVPGWKSGLYCYCNGGAGAFSLDCNEIITIDDICESINSHAADGWVASSSVGDVTSDKIPNVNQAPCYTSAYIPSNTLLSGCNYTAYMGDGTQEIDSRVTGNTQAAKAKLVGGMKYDTYLAMTLKSGEYVSGNPNITAVWKGRIVRVYTSTTEYTEEWSDNVWCPLDFMTSPDGCNIPIEDIDIQSFITAAAYAQPTDGSRRWSINLILDESKSRQDWLNEMLLCFRAFRTYQNGKHGILIDKPEPVSQVFIVKPTESIQHDWQELGEDYERVILKYIDPDYEWQKVGASATIKTGFRGTVPLTKTVEVNGITNFAQASQHAWFYLNQAQTCSDFITYTCNKRALNRTIGDVIGIYDPITQVTEPGLTYKRYRILAMTEPQGMEIQLYCCEYNEDLYTDELGSVAPVVSVTKLPNTSIAPPAVTGLTATEYGWMTAEGVHISNIDVAFTAADYFDVVSYIVSLSEDDGTTWRYINTINSTAYRVAGVKIGACLVGVQAVNKAGIIGAKSIVGINVVGKDNLPPDVDTLLVEKLASGAYRFSFSLTDPPVDVAGYRLKYNVGSSTWWANAIPLHSGLIAASPFETMAIPSGTATVMIKVVDNAGNESENVAYAIIGLGDPVVENVLYEYDMKSTGFTGLKTGCHTDSNGYLVADDTGGLFYPADDNAAIYPSNNSELFYRTTWSAITYEDSFLPEYAGLLSFGTAVDGNAVIYYRRQYPYAMYGADYDLFYPNDDELMYKEGPYTAYTGKVETTAEPHQVKIEIAAGATQGIIRELTAVIDVPDQSESLDDIVISASGTRLPIKKTYRAIKNVNCTIQEVDGSTAFAIKTVDKNATLGPLIMCYDKSGAAVTGVIDATIQGVRW